MQSHLTVFRRRANTVQDFASQFIVSTQIANSLSLAHFVLKLTTTGSAIKQPVMICFHSKYDLLFIIHTTSTGDLV